MSDKKLQHNVYFQEDQMDKLKELQAKLRKENKDRSISQLIRELTMQALQEQYGN